jgi:hypothetical protein
MIQTDEPRPGGISALQDLKRKKAPWKTTAWRPSCGGHGGFDLTHLTWWVFFLVDFREGTVSRNVKHIKTLIGPWSWSNLGCQISVTTLFPKPLSCVLWRLRFMVHAVSFIFDYYSWHLRHHCADHVCNIRSHFRETIELNYIIMLNQFWTDVLICHWKLTDIYNYLSYSLCVFHIFSR